MAPPEQRRAQGPGPLVTHDTDVAFAQGWHAQVIALAFNLVEQGHFSNAQWSERLGAELASANGRGDSDNHETYYCAALTALEGLLNDEQAVSAESIDERTEAWRAAYLSTPHGKPVKL